MGKDGWMWAKKMICWLNITGNMETVEELIYFWTMSENRFNKGDRKKIRQTEKYWEMRESG